MNSSEEHDGTDVPTARAALQWAVAVAGPVGIGAAFIPLRDHVASADIALLLALVIVLAAVLGGRRFGVIAAIAAAASFDFFFTRPYYLPVIKRAEDVETARADARGRRSRSARSSTRAQRDRVAATVSRAGLERVARFTEVASGGEPPGRLIRVARNALIELLDLEDCEFERPPFFDALPRLTHSGLSIPPPIEVTDAAESAARRARRAPRLGRRSRDRAVRADARRRHVAARLRSVRAHDGDCPRRPACDRAALARALKSGGYWDSVRRPLRSAGGGADAASV